MMKKIHLTRNDVMPLALLLISFPLLITGVLLKSLLVLAGVTGLMTAWFLCINHVIANYRMGMKKRIVFGGIIVFLPLLFYFFLGA